MTTTLHRAHAAAVAVLLLFCLGTPARADAPYRGTATSRIKDLANIEGVRQNQLIGYGLVVGLNGTGDTLNNIPFTRQSLQAMLERLGVNIRGQTLRTGNVAAVMVTANLPAFGTQGSRIDVTVSALGDAKSLQGGTLLVTPLLGADGNVAPTATSTRWDKARSRSAASRPKAMPPRSCAGCRRSDAFPTAPLSSARSISRSTG
jgi:flagellar P-ring protein precursor FlgI